MNNTIDETEKILLIICAIGRMEGIGSYRYKYLSVESIQQYINKTKGKLISIEEIQSVFDIDNKKSIGLFSECSRPLDNPNVQKGYRFSFFNSGTSIA